MQQWSIIMLRAYKKRRRSNVATTKQNNPNSLHLSISSSILSSIMILIYRTHLIRVFKCCCHTIYNISVIPPVCFRIFCALWILALCHTSVRDDRFVHLLFPNIPSVSVYSLPLVSLERSRQKNIAVDAQISSLRWEIGSPVLPLVPPLPSRPLLFRRRVQRHPLLCVRASRCICSISFDSPFLVIVVVIGGSVLLLRPSL